MLDLLERPVLVAQARDELTCLVVVAGRGPIQRHQAIERTSLHRLEHLFFGDAGPLGDLRGRGRATVLLAQRGDDPAQLQVQLLHPPGYADGPTAIAEVSLQLAEDRRRRERRELEPTLGVETLDRLQEANQRDLDEVVDRFPAVRESSGQEMRKRGVLLDQVVAEPAVTGAAVDGEALVDPTAVAARVVRRRVFHHRHQPGPSATAARLTRTKPTSLAPSTSSNDSDTESTTSSDNGDICAGWLTPT